MSLKSSIKNKDLITGSLVVLAFIVASLIGNVSTIDFLSRILVFMLFATAVNIILGYGGLRPLGQGMYLGLSAYSYLVLVVRFGINVYLALLLAIIITVLFSLIIGIVSLKSNDDLAFAFFNMGVNTVLFTAIQKMQIVGSDTGITGAVRLPFATSTQANFYVILAVTVVSIVAIYAFLKSPFARILVGSRENILRLTFVGVNTRNVRLIAYIISSFFCGIAGLLYAMRNLGAFPIMISTNASLDGLIMCLVGGMSHFFGPMLGATIMTFVTVQISNLTPYYQAIYGVIIILCILFLRGGILRKRDKAPKLQEKESTI